MSFWRLVSHEFHFHSVFLVVIAEPLSERHLLYNFFLCLAVWVFVVLGVLSLLLSEEVHIPVFGVAWVLDHISVDLH